MKNRAVTLLLLAACFFTASAASAQTVKIGTVDMKKVFESYYKTKDAEARINEARNSAKKELDDRMDHSVDAAWRDEQLARLAVPKA